ncbi:MAG: basic secretory family protein [Odoribacteraceae bacterium]|jgi:hypothetical protein|nr:basic secretory family protein [Odoribacteraceae bacterium]
MKTIAQTLAALLAGIFFLVACSGDPETPPPPPAEEEEVVDIWKDYDAGNIRFENRAATTPGGRVTGAIAEKDPLFFDKIARRVLAILYFSPEDSITKVRNLTIRLEDFDGVAYATSDNTGNIIAMSCRWIGSTFLDTRDTVKVADEIIGVLLHEMTHVYQLEPRAPGGYGSNAEVWACIEGTADAVRYLAGSFAENDVGAGGSYMDGYRTTGFFLGWIQKTKDPDFLRLFNRAALHVQPWTFPAAFRYALGDSADINALWVEYQAYRRTVN